MLRRLSAIALILLLGTPLNWAAAQTLYVRADGSDAACDGTTDEPASGAPTCAELTIAAALTDAADNDGDTIKVGQGRFPAAITVADANIVIEALDANMPKPIIGTAIYMETGDNWTLDPDSNQDATTGAPLYVYRSATGLTAPQLNNGSISSGAYITNISDYENGRVALIPYRSASPSGGGALAWLRAPTEAFTTSTAFYRGPGVVWEDDPNGQNRYYISLRSTQDVSNYEGALSPLFAGDFDPDHYDITIGTASANVNIQASNVTLRNLQVEPAARTVLLGGSGQTLSGILFDEMTIWAGSSSAIATNQAATAINGVTIQNSQIYGDVPYWLSWSDAKISPAPADQFRHTLISIGRDGSAGSSDAAATTWRITRSHIRGGHDGIGIDGDANGITIDYNRIENFADDPFEIELDSGETLGDLNIVGNYIANSLVCWSLGQDSAVGTWTGPVSFYRNICALLRPAHINSDGACSTQDWHGGTGPGFCYGHPYAFKWGDVTDHNTNIWNNTIITSIPHRSYGLNIVGSADSGIPQTHSGDYVYNNLFISVNDRPGDGDRLNGHNFTELDNNLYYTMNMKDASPFTRNLLGPWDTVAQACAADPNTECSGLGAGADPNTGTWGTNPLFETTNGFGCFVDQTCAGFDKTFGNRWSPFLLSTHWRPSAFGLESGSPACDSGRGSDVGGFPTATVDPNGTIANDTADMGAIPCGATVSALDYEPMTFDWPCTDTAANTPPTITITSPTRRLINTYAGLAQNFCATVSDPDGHGPYTYLWDFTGTGCPTDNTSLCPGDITFSTASTCTVVFRATDRCGVVSPLPPANPDGSAGYHVRVYTRGGVSDSGTPSGGCSDCRRCVCDRVDP